MNNLLSSERDCMVYVRRLKERQNVIKMFSVSHPHGLLVLEAPEPKCGCSQVVAEKYTLLRVHTRPPPPKHLVHPPVSLGACSTLHFNIFKSNSDLHNPLSAINLSYTFTAISPLGLASRALELVVAGGRGGGGAEGGGGEVIWLWRRRRRSGNVVVEKQVQ
jgi:hypothetical protein